MTVIAAAVTDRGAAIASDGACFEDGIVWPCTTKLVVRDIGKRRIAERVVLGSYGDLTLNSLVRHSLIFPELPPAGDEDTWAFAVAAALVDLARNAGACEKGRMPGGALLGFRKRVWSIDEMNAMPIETFAAVGAGGTVAQGYLDAKWKPTANPTNLAARAAYAACRHNAFCRPPVYVEKIQ